MNTLGVQIRHLHTIHLYINFLRIPHNKLFVWELGHCSYCGHLYHSGFVAGLAARHLPHSMKPFSMINSAVQQIKQTNKEMFCKSLNFGEKISIPIMNSN